MQLHLYALLHNPLHVAHNSFNVVAFAGKASSCCNANANAIWHVASGRCKVATGLGLVALHKGHGAYACVCVCAPTCGDLLSYKLFIAYCSMPRRSATPRPRPTAMQQFASLCHICFSCNRHGRGRGRKLHNAHCWCSKCPPRVRQKRNVKWRGFGGGSGRWSGGERGGGKVDGGCPLVVDSVKFK